MSGHVAKHPLSQPFDRHGVANLRRLVGRHAADLGLPDSRRQDLVLAVDEIATNAVRHGGGSGVLDLWVSGQSLWFRVSDHGPGMTDQSGTQRPGPTQLGGRGLWIAREITDQLTIVTGPNGTVVTGVVGLS